MYVQAIGFAGVLAVVGLGVDYHQQSQRAGLSLGQMGVGEYVGTITGRIDGVKAEKLAQKAEYERKLAWKAGGKPFLPEAGAGWTRRGFDEGDNTAIIPAYVLKGRDGVHPASNYLAEAKLDPGQTLETAPKAEGMAAMMGQRLPRDWIEATAPRSWVYQRGDEAIFIEIRFHDAPNLKTAAGLGRASMKAAMGGVQEGQDVGFAVIGGVGFTEALNANGKRANHYRILQGRFGLGQEIDIRVHANASSVSTRDLLSAIDFDGLNRLLVQPMATVGNDVQPSPGTDEMEIAETMVTLHQEFIGLIGAEAQYRIKNMRGAALMVNALAERSGVAPDGLVDVTLGTAISMEQMIHAGYRKAIQDLMAGQSVEDHALGLRDVMHAAMHQHAQGRAAAKVMAGPGKEAEMSPQLAAELGVDPGASRPTLDMSDEEHAAMAVRMMDIMAKGDKQARARMALASTRQFERLKGYPDGSCQLREIGAASRFMCNASAKAVQKAEASPNVDLEFGGAEGNLIVSKPIDFSNAPADLKKDGAAIQLGLMFATKEFEKKFGLPRGSCMFDGTRSRLVCDPTKTPTKDKATASVSTDPQPKVKVRRLGGGTRKAGGCGAGQFCSAGN